LRIVVATSNPTKVAGALRALKEFLPNEPIDLVMLKVDNRVGPQPIGLDNIVVGAMNRALNAYRAQLGDLYIAIEAGLFSLCGQWLDIHVCIVCDRTLRCSIGTSLAFPLPTKFAREVLFTSKELDQVVDEVFGTKDIGSHGGVIKILTHNIINREDLVYQCVASALIPWINHELYEFFSLESLAPDQRQQS